MGSREEEAGEQGAEGAEEENITSLFPSSPLKKRLKEFKLNEPHTGVMPFASLEQKPTACVFLVLDS
ncbi:MAG: hypothetical protein V7L11_14055 [Nostoc sp.]|uniref:hypothetical protein n=1 Tax=Nostoc sp. TaxID=1180 RepID=UPI002FFBC512